MKIRPVGAEFFHADRQIDVTKLIVAFRSFSDAPKKRIGDSSKFIWGVKILKTRDFQYKRIQYSSRLVE